MKLFVVLICAMCKNEREREGERERDYFEVEIDRPVNIH